MWPGFFTVQLTKSLDAPAQFLRYINRPGNIALAVCDPNTILTVTYRQVF